MKPSESLAALLADRGLTAHVRSWKALLLEIPELPEGVSVRLSRNRFAKPDPDDPFAGWKFRYRVSKDHLKNAAELRRVAALKTWEKLRAVGLLPEEAPDSPERVALSGE